MGIFEMVVHKWRELKQIWSDLHSVLAKIDKLNNKIEIELNNRQWETMKEEEGS